MAPFRFWGDLCRMLNQTLNYLDHFARFTQKENVEAVERLLSAHKDLAKFERAQLGTSEPFHPLLPMGFLSIKAVQDKWTTFGM
jgi:hypothetical protein